MGCKYTSNKSRINICVMELHHRSILRYHHDPSSRVRDYPSFCRHQWLEDTRHLPSLMWKGLMEDFLIK